MNNINNMGGILFGRNPEYRRNSPTCSTSEPGMHQKQQGRTRLVSAQREESLKLQLGMLPMILKTQGITWRYPATIQFPIRIRGIQQTSCAIKFRQAVFYAVRTHRTQVYFPWARMIPTLGTLNLIIGKKVTDFNLI